MKRILLLALMPMGIALAQPSGHPVSINLSTGYAWFSPGDLNTYLAKLTLPEVQGGITAVADVGYHFMSQMSLHLGVGYMQGSSKGSYGVTGETGPTVIAYADETYSVTSFPLALGMRYHVAGGDLFTLAAGADVEMHLLTVKYELQSTAYSEGTEETRSGTGFGLRLALMPEYSLSQTVAIKADLGYRLARINDVNGTSGFFPPQMNIDLSGPFAVAGVSLRL
jgi:opacity protein-like surface antigen